MFLYFIYSTLALNFDRFNNSPRNAFKHELTLLERVRHPNVVQFVGAVTQNIPMMIVREYHSKVGLPSLFLCIFAKYSLFFAYINVDFQGDLASYLQKKGRLSPSKVLRFCHDIARQVTIFKGLCCTKSLWTHLWKTFMSFSYFYYIFLIWSLISESRLSHFLGLLSLPCTKWL